MHQKVSFRRFFLLVLLLLAIPVVHAQDWTRRHQFAKTYFGLSTFVAPNWSDGPFLNPDGQVQSYGRSGFGSPSINIGATHFWGYADFYISINTVGIKFQEDEIKNSIRLGTFTGCRVYPFPSKIGTVRPYLGYKFSPFRFKQYDLEEASFSHTSVQSVLDVGLALQLPSFYLTLEYSRVLNPSFTNYLSRTISRTDQFPNQLIQLGINYTLETTAFSNAPGNKAAYKYFSATNRYGLFFAAGPSSAFPTANSEYLQEHLPFLDDRAFPSLFADVAAGYHFSKLDLITAASFRAMAQKRSAFDYEQAISRKSVVLECYKFLGDYHGFVPYLGLGLSYERLKLSETDRGMPVASLAENTLSPALVFGWDIRPSVQGDWWILRTNLRYFPFLGIDRDGQQVSLQYVEFNFIQFVVYPQRLGRIRKGNL
ncbi:hypothetical protein [Pontibacter sp. G13]|uniref:hypothetical protein n=1 Tax=Pontibacter sp. G13 TaxID=3074898 RepID=UPI002889AB7D|nr:hypothetical protein [Pontibacter sp. G13]WNJ19087.1 hypothetical protein RJD25_01235 [Pontibacter sp. G13]